MSKNPKYLNWTIIIFSSVIILSILWNTFLFVQNFKNEERNKMELWSLATLELVNIQGNISNLTLEVLKKNTTTPMIKVDNNGFIEINNIPELNPKDSLEIKRLISKFQSEKEFLNQCKKMPLKIGSNPLEIAKTVEFILSIQSMTGQIITLDGGQHLGWGQVESKRTNKD